MKAFQLLIKPVSAGCNLSCEYCFYRRVEDLYPKQPTERMPDAVLERLLSEHLGYRFKQSVYGWQGGEPTLAGLDFFKKVVGLQQRFGAKGQVVCNSLQTNGILLDEKWCEFLGEYKFLVGLSIDGPPELHDRYRKDYAEQGSHDRVMQAARLMRAHRVEFNALTVITPALAERAKEVYRWFVAHDFNYMQFIPCCDLDPTTGKPSQWFVTPEQYGQFLCDMFDTWYPDGVGKISLRLFDAMMAYAADGRISTWCTFGERCDEYLLVEYNGDVYPCDFFVYPELKLASIAEGQTLDDAISSPLRKKFAGDKKPSETCKKCRFMAHCHGGCQKDRLLSTDGRSVYCKAYQKFFAHTEKAFAKLGEQVKELRKSRIQTVTTPVGRNELCPCGSGRKYKHCCGG